MNPHYRPQPQISKGYDSVLGVGHNVPDPKQSKQFDGMTVPCGKPTTVEKYGLSQNEHIIYKPEQCRMRYLLWFKGEK